MQVDLYNGRKAGGWVGGISVVRVCLVVGGEYCGGGGVHDTTPC